MAELENYKIGTTDPVIGASSVLVVDGVGVAIIDKMLRARLSGKRDIREIRQGTLFFVFINIFERLHCFPESIPWGRLDESDLDRALPHGAMAINFEVKADSSVGKMELILASEFLAGVASGVPLAVQNPQRHPSVASDFNDAIFPTLKTLLDNWIGEVRREKRPPDELIEPELTEEELHGLPLRERLAALDRHARANPNVPVSEYVLRFLPELGVEVREDLQKRGSMSAAQALPKRAPERWPTNPGKRTENPAEFATRVYRPWMDAGLLTRQDLKRLDPILFASLDYWMKNNRRKPKPDPLPEGFNLLTIEQANSVWVDRVKSGQERFPDDPDALAKFANALQYRALEASKGK